jgi:hypothetical protein
MDNKKRKNFNSKNGSNTYKKGGTRKDKRSNKSSNSTNSWKESGSNAEYTDATESGNPANDPTYFIPATEQGLLESLTAFSFPQVMGKSFSLQKRVSGSENDALKVALPTASQIRISPVVGPSVNSVSDPINVAASNIYVQQSARNNKNTLYAPQDSMTLVLAMGQIVAIEEFIRRVLKFSFLVDSRNFDVPRGYFTAMGVDFDDYRRNVANYRDQFNVLVSKINAITFMADIPYIKKCSEIYSSVYRDSMTDMYGVHFVVPGHTWMINETAYDQGTVLIDTPVVERNTIKTLAQYLGILDSMIDAVKLSSTFNVIYSDILSLYNETHFNTITIPLFSIVETANIEYNPMFNIMLRHATIVGDNKGDLIDPTSTSTTRWGNTVIPDASKNTLYMTYHFEAPDDFIAYDRFINFFETNSPDANTRFEMTRWMVVGDAEHIEGDSYVTVDYPILQDSIVNSVDLYLNDRRVFQAASNTLDASVPANMLTVNSWLTMANLPMKWLVTKTNYVIDKAVPLTDVDSWSTVDAKYLSNITNMAMIHYFGI